MSQNEVDQHQQTPMSPPPAIDEASISRMNRPELIHFLNTQNVPLSPREHRKDFYLQKALAVIRDTNPSAPPIEDDLFLPALDDQLHAPGADVNDHAAAAAQGREKPSWHARRSHGKSEIEPCNSGMAQPFTPIPPPSPAGNLVRDEAGPSGVRRVLADSFTDPPTPLNRTSKTRQDSSSFAASLNGFLSLLCRYWAFVEYSSKIHGDELYRDLRIMYTWFIGMVAAVLQIGGFFILLPVTCANKASDWLEYELTRLFPRTRVPRRRRSWVGFTARATMMAVIACLVYRFGAEKLGL